MDTRARAPSPRFLSSMGEGALYWKALEPVLQSISIHDGGKVFLAQFSQVTRSQGLLFAATWCEIEVCNGGFHQFFYNSTGVLAPEAVEGLRYIGLPKAARLVVKAVRMFGKSYPRNRGERKKRLEKLLRPGEKREEWDPFFALDSKFYERDAAGDFAARADHFVRQHLDVFFV